MKIELNDEAVDGLIKSILIQDYKGLCQDITNLEESEELANYQKEDLKNNYRYRNAMEVMMEYYVSMNWKQEL